MVDKARFPILRSQRLVLRRIHENDANSIFKLRTDAVVNTFIQRPQGRADNNGLEFVNRIQYDLSKNKIYHWVIVSSESSELLGSICLWNFNVEKTIAEVGYELFPKYYGQGIMSEALTEVIDFGFRQLQLTSIEAFTHRDNERSTKLLIKNGFELSPNRSDVDNLNNIIFIKQKAC
ncbi:MAG: GNAT family N-acetyltransferase [Bacteroidia bacterium]|nr:GNAT family N-acetyltransferase [Bacteroidia bacterium]NND26572.1 GNAT family N-acetyltransferase [Flavobacteriaceae bacterium]NNK61456.1 GNAT family N-acetyltransferase [Flavobacteriaceae bacterium]RZW55918.1 MAG: N-acetyltransferase [Flavobacteriaceae bacterium]